MKIGMVEILFVAAVVFVGWYYSRKGNEPTGLQLFGMILVGGLAAQMIVFGTGAIVAIAIAGAFIWKKLDKLDKKEN